MTPRQCLVDRRDHRFIGEHCIDMGHPRLLQIFDLSRDEPITEATLRVSRFNQVASCTSDMQYHCRRPDRLLLVFASHQERFAILLLRSWTRFDSFVTRIDYTCSPVQFLLFPSQADGRASRGFLRRKVASIDHRQAGADGLAERRGGAAWATRPEAGPMTDEIIVERRGRDQCISWRVRHDGTHYYVERGRVRTRM